VIDRTIETDVLIVGGGGGGLRAAIAAHDEGARVTVISKGIVGKSGLTQTAVTGFQAAFGIADPRDNADVHFQDSIKGGYGLADPALVRTYTGEAVAAVEDMEEFGCRFDRDENGALFQRKLDSSQTYPRSIKKGDSLGTPIMQALRRQAKIREIEQLHEIYVTKLLVASGRIAGAVAIDFRTGETLSIRAGAVIMATGGAGELFPVNSNTPDSTGDGLMLALDAGAELVDLEFILMLGHAMLHPEAVRGMLFTFQYLLPKGARGPFNNDGEPFLANYDPEGSDNPARHIYARAIFGEVRAGRGTPHGGVWFDPGSVPLEVLQDTLPSQTKYLQSFGLDVSKPFEVGVAAHYMCGGIRIDVNAESTLPGLFAVGECSGGAHGAARVGGNSLTEILVFGKRAGRNAAAAAKGGLADFNNEEADAEANRVLSLLDRDTQGRRPSAIKADIQKTMNDYVGVVRNEDGLASAVATFDELAERDLPAMSPATDGRVANYDWIEMLEVSAMTRLANLIASAARMRKESRGAHYREDFPDTNDRDWLRNTRIRQENGAPALAPVAVAADMAGAA
jgi:fumarate reductase (CoM/CoB) subunit A